MLTRYKLQDFAVIQGDSIDPRKRPDSIWSLYSLPAFDDNQNCERILGKEILSNKYIVPDKCILFNKLNVRFKRIWRINNSDDLKICSTEFLPLVIDESKVDFDFCYYLLQRDDITSFLEGQNSGTSGSHKRINPNSFMEMEVDLPALDEQIKIASVLCSLDDKITHNNLLCSHLEHIAHELFNYYFNNTYFKKSTENGWVRKNILQLCEATRGVTYGKDDLLPAGTGGVLVLRGNNIQNDCILFDNNVAYVSSSLVSSEQHIYTNDILITMSSGSKEHLGKCAMFHYDSPHTYGAFLSKFSPKGDYAHFIWGILSSDYFKQSIKTMSNGTGINNLSADILERIYFWFPPEPIMKDFESAATPLYNQMGIYEQENICLKEEKQRLLSLLLSGTLSVE